MTLKKDAEYIYTSAIAASLPDNAVRTALQKFKTPKGKILLVSIGKAAWQMAKTAYDCLYEKIDAGIVITKYAHSKGAIGDLEIYEAAHPVPDENGIKATKRALDLTEGLAEDDVVIFLVSGGGSALFEYVDFPLSDLSEVTSQMLASGASIEEMNTVRKHLSEVKGGRFAEHVYPAKIYAVVLSDVVSSRLDVIASGPAVADSSTVEQTEAIIDKYSLLLTEKQKELSKRETPKKIGNAVHEVSGSVSELCLAAKKAAETLGYEAEIVNAAISGEAREEGAYIGSLAATLKKEGKENLALIFGGETVVHLRGNGMGGRNQELALAAAKEISGLEGVAVFSVGSDGTDGPTDAAGGYVDARTYSLIENCESFLENNDSYNALRLSDGLIFTGPTGTNVNDLAVILIK